MHLQRKESLNHFQDTSQLTLKEYRYQVKLLETDLFVFENYAGGGRGNIKIVDGPEQNMI